MSDTHKKRFFKFQDMYSLYYECIATLLYKYFFNNIAFLTIYKFYNMKSIYQNLN